MATVTRMSKEELVEAIANATNQTKAATQQMVDAYADVITKALKKGNQVALVGFGTYGVKKRAARTGRNPQTGETLNIPAATVPFFKPGKGLKEAVNTKGK